MSEIPVLSLWQPWATLVALGVKSIETRSWSTKYRGPIAIHAAARRPPLMHLPRLHPVKANGYRPPREIEDEHNGRTWFVCDTITDPAWQRPLRSNPPERVPLRAQTPTLFFPHRGEHADVNPETGYARTLHLPLGAILATVVVLDCVPIVADRPSIIDTPPGRWVSAKTWRVTLHESDGLMLTSTPLAGEAPFGDYTPGRWAWLLDDVRPLAEPVPFRGGQGLTRRVDEEVLDFDG